MAFFHSYVILKYISVKFYLILSNGSDISLILVGTQ